MNVYAATSSTRPVQCGSSSACGGDIIESTINDCCSHNRYPPGIAYTIEGEVGCNLCPVGK